jgi:hypothetical protein
MKRIIVSFFALLLIAGSAFSQKKIAKEEEAIKETIKKEFALFWERNTDAESDFWVKEDYMTTVNTGENSHFHNHGWDSIYAQTKRGSEHENWQYLSNLKTELTDFQIKVFDKVAWAVYYGHNTWEFKGEPYDAKFVRVNFLEKVGDNWKIALTATSTLNPCKKEEYQVQKQYLQEK